MSQTLSTSIQRTVALALTGSSVGISYTTLFVESRTQHKLLGRLVDAARYVAHFTCVLGLLLNLHLVNGAYEATLGRGSILYIPETAAYFTFTLIVVQVYHGIVGFLLVHRVKSIIPWARDQERFTTFTFTFVMVLVLVPAICACVALAQTPSMYDYLLNPRYNRVYKVAFSIQSLFISVATVVMDVFILRAIAKAQAQLNANDKKTMARLRKQMVIIGIAASATTVELSVRIYALTATYVAVDFYIKMLCISLDTHAFTSLGVCLSDVLAKNASRSAIQKGGGGSSSLTGGAGAPGGGGNSTLVPQLSMTYATSGGRRQSQQPIMLQSRVVGDS